MATPRRTLLIAAGGGGDALAALMVADAAGLDPASTVVASFAWERTMFDPRPGPRPPDHFTHLRRKGRHNWQITGRSRLREERAWSFLPQLAGERSTSIWLLDAREGVEGLQRQLHEAAELHEAHHVLVVDVGGDILARGDESWVKSPTADAMVLAAAATLAIASYVVVLGIGLDGELSPGDLDARLSRIQSDVAGLPERLPARTARRFAESFLWSPSEATGLAYMAARGWRGRAEIRRDGVEVELSQMAAEIHGLCGDRPDAAFAGGAGDERHEVARRRRRCGSSLRPPARARGGALCAATASPTSRSLHSRRARATALGLLRRCAQPRHRLPHDASHRRVART